MPNLEETSIVMFAINGDQQAFTKLVKAKYQRIYNFNLKYFGDHDLAMEATQKTFISAHKHIGKLKSPDSFNSWIYTIAANQCKEEDRKSKRRWFLPFFSDASGQQGSEEGELKASLSSDFDPEREFQHEELSGILLKALASIPAEQKMIVIMKEYEGLKFKEIAIALNISENTAKSRLYYGLNALRKVLEQWNIKKEEMYHG